MAEEILNWPPASQSAEATAHATQAGKICQRVDADALSQIIDLEPLEADAARREERAEVARNWRGKFQPRVRARMIDRETHRV